MDRTAFTHMAATESTHWWFVGRRAVIDALLDGISLPASGQILEAGCGTGGNLASLSRRGQIRAFEPHIDALAFARAKHPEIPISEASLPHPLPYEPGSFDLVAALDVLEHVDNDVDAAQALTGLVRPGGWLLVTVPAHQALWGSHDRRLHHMRRYSRRQVLSLFATPDMELIRFTPFNLILSPIAIVYRAAERALGIDLGNQERLPPAILNTLLARTFAFESRLLRRGARVPFGLSYAAIFRRRTSGV